MNAHVTKPEKRTSELTNTFWFSFEIDKREMIESGIHQLRRVLPTSEGMQIISSIYHDGYNYSIDRYVYIYYSSSAEWVSHIHSLNLFVLCV